MAKRSADSGMNALAPLAAGIAKAQDEAMASSPVAARLRGRVLSVAKREARRRESSSWWMLLRAARADLVVSAVVGAVLALVGAALWPAEPLTFHVAGREDAATQVGAWIQAGPGADLALWFSDGSVLGLRPGGRMKVSRLSADGANVVLSEGAAHVVIVHRSRTRWLVEAGPFQVRVTGTRFSVGWTPSSGEFALELEEGSVVVQGGCLASPRTLAKGEQVHVRCASPSAVDLGASGSGAPALSAGPAPLAAETTTSGAPGIETKPVVAPGAEPVAAPGVETKPVVATGAPAARTPLSAATVGVGAATLDARSTAPRPAWVPSAAPVGSEGVTGVTEPPPATARDLLSAADAARRAGQRGRAIDSLRDVRLQFPATPQAAIAAFDLGVLAYDGGQMDASAGWFETYLREAPSGALRRETLGRLLETHLRAGYAAGAREAATRYLHEYPSGPHAELARELLH